MASVWLLDADTGANTAAVFRGWLSATEEQRFQSFTRTLRREQFLAGRGLLRLALGRLLAVPPCDVVLAERPGQAPLLVAPGADGVGFSLSHSRNWVACAVSADTLVGLDIEVRDSARNIDALAAHAFGPVQRHALAGCPEGDRMDAFYRIWSEQEARIKLGVPCVQVVHLEHPVLAIALGSARRLDTAPPLQLARIEQANGQLSLTSLTGEGTAGRPAP